LTTQLSFEVFDKYIKFYLTGDSLEVFDKYIKFYLTGDSLLEDIIDIITTMERMSKENNRTKILIDAVNVTPPTQLERFRMGEIAASTDKHKNRIALFTKPEIINKFFENVAVNRGVSITVVGSEQEALDWLLSEIPQTHYRPVFTGRHKNPDGAPS
jgi:hypothetical protein